MTYPMEIVSNDLARILTLALDAAIDGVPRGFVLMVVEFGENERPFEFRSNVRLDTAQELLTRALAHVDENVEAFIDSYGSSSGHGRA